MRPSPSVPPPRRRSALAAGGRGVVFIAIAVAIGGFLVGYGLLGGDRYEKRTIEGIPCITGPNGALSCDWENSR